MHLSFQDSGPLVVSIVGDSAKDITGKNVGDPVTVACNIESCRDDLYAIEFLGPNDEVLSSVNSSESMTISNYVRTLEVDNTGTFTCLARLEGQPQLFASATFTFEGSIFCV